MGLEECPASEDAEECKLHKTGEEAGGEVKPRSPSSTASSERGSWAQRHLGSRGKSFQLILTKTVKLAPQFPEKSIDYEMVSSFMLCLLFYVCSSLTPLSHGYMMPQDGVGWALFATWLGANVCGRLLGAAGLPPLAGQLVGGVLIKNLRIFHSHALTHHWKATIRSFGLGVIMMRSGSGSTRGGFT